MVAYVHIQYSTYQFSEESKGGGIHSPPARSLRYRKKRGSERRIKGALVGTVSHGVPSRTVDTACNRPRIIV